MILSANALTCRKNVLMELYVFLFSREQVSINARIKYIRISHVYFIFKIHTKNAVRILGRRSENSLYNQELVSMDLQGGYNPVDAGGFIRAHAVRLKEYYRIKNESEQ